MKSVISLTVNGRQEEVEVPSHWSLIQLLRQGLHLLGTGEGCGEGACGSCTVLVDGRLARSCLYLAIRAQGRDVLTIEGLQLDGVLDPVQQAFVDQGAVQCGFCSPGMVLSTKVLLDKNPNPTDQEIREHLSGNICRCGGYSLILAAVRQAAEVLGNGPTSDGRAVIVTGEDLQ
jgi:carbon-monoxide dehydrogenase small subunit